RLATLSRIASTMRWALSPLSSRGFAAASKSGAVDRGRAGVLELLLGAEEGVEHGLASVLAEDQGQAGTDEGEEDEAAELALAALALRRAQRLGGVTEALGCDAEVLLHLLVAGYRLDGTAVAARPRVGMTGRVEGLLEAVAQFFVLDQALDVGILARGRIKVGGLAGPCLAHALLAGSSGALRITLIYPDDPCGQAKASSRTYSVEQHTIGAEAQVGPAD